MEQRNQLKLAYRDLTPASMLTAIEARNLTTYGNKLGPSVEQIRAQGKSLQQIINSAARPGGEDMNFAHLGFGSK